MILKQSVLSSSSVKLKLSISKITTLFVDLYGTPRFDEGLTLETSAFLPFTVANLRFQLSC